MALAIKMADALPTFVFTGWVALACLVLVGITDRTAREDEEHPVGCICPRHRVRRAA